jgi:DNA invertase Pin-like site-specific DNA recombinase
VTVNEGLSDIGVHDFDLAWLGCHETVEHSVLRKRSILQVAEERSHPVPESSLRTRLNITTPPNTFLKTLTMTTMIGYSRVSTNDQDDRLQIDDLKAAGCKRIFTDTASGSKANRPELDKMLDHLREGDTVVVWRLDRLGRSLKNLIELVALFEEKGVGFRSLKGEAIDTTTSGGRLIFHVFAALAQFERELIVERTNAGLAAARARGRVGGRPSVMTAKKVDKARKLYDSRQHTVAEIAEMLDVSVATIYRHLQPKTQESLAS